jgi:hypothetical protein
MRVLLHDVAHARAGDKGNLTTLALTAYDVRWYPALEQYVTAPVVRDHLADRVTEGVVRHALPGLRTLVFVCPREAHDTVTTSVRLDPHGKSLSSALLTLGIDVADGFRPT